MNTAKYNRYIFKQRARIEYVHSIEDIMDLPTNRSKEHVINNERSGTFAVGWLLNIQQWELWTSLQQADITYQLSNS